jgi:hypothetical protein
MKNVYRGDNTVVVDRLERQFRAKRILPEVEYPDLPDVEMLGRFTGVSIGFIAEAQKSAELMQKSGGRDSGLIDKELDKLRRLLEEK